MLERLSTSPGVTELLMEEQGACLGLPTPHDVFSLPYAALMWQGRGSRTQAIADWVYLRLRVTRKTGAAPLVPRLGKGVEIWRESRVHACEGGVQVSAPSLARGTCSPNEPWQVDDAWEDSWTQKPSLAPHSSPAL